jgi:hypothetical protein
MVFPSPLDTRFVRTQCRELASSHMSRRMVFPSAPEMFISSDPNAGGWPTTKWQGGSNSIRPTEIPQYSTGSSTPVYNIAKTESSTGGGGDHPGLINSNHPLPRRCNGYITCTSIKGDLPHQDRPDQNEEHHLSSIVLEIQTHGSPSLANQTPPNFGNRRRRTRSTYLNKNFCHLHSPPLWSWKP